MSLPPKQEKTGSTPSQQASRIGKKVISGYFDPAVAKAMKRLALDLDTNIQGIMTLAFNDLLEKHGQKRIADESMVPSNLASQKR